MDLPSNKPMEIPSAMMIESAAEELNDVTQPNLDAQRKELESAMGDQPDEFQAGYELGLQTARVMLQGDPKAVAAGVTL